MSMSSRKRSARREYRQNERRKIRRGTRAVLDGLRSRVSHIGPNWSSNKHMRDIPDNEAGERE